MASHGFDPGNPNKWYQSPHLGLIPVGYGGEIAGNCYNHSPVGASYHSVTNFTHPNSYPPPHHFTQPNPYPPPQNNYYAPPPYHFTQPHSNPPPQHSATLINGHLLPLRFPCASQTQAQYHSPHMQPTHSLAPQRLTTTTPQIPSIPSYYTPHPNSNLQIRPPISPNSSVEPLVVHSHLWRARCKQVALESTAATEGVKKPSRSRLGTVLPRKTCNSQKRYQLLMRKPKFQRLLGAITQDVKTGYHQRFVIWAVWRSLICPTIISLVSFQQVLKACTACHMSMYHYLEGPLPKSKAFQEAPLEALLGNKGLCGEVGPLKLCSVQSSRKYQKQFLIIVSLLAALAFLAAILAIVIVIERKKRHQHQQDTNMHVEISFSVLGYDGKMMYKEIIKATQDFDSTYCIGKGGHGSVYRANLSSANIVAVKKLHLLHSEDDHFQKEFLNEIRALTQIRHRNIVKLYGFCLHKRHSFLVYEYLERGSLATLLSSDHEAQELGWSKRMNIVKDVANALC
ncbi:hypothetical protein ACLB2K_050923 [Fragaria x ananassa]